jgi:hypothetical protein
MKLLTKELKKRFKEVGQQENIKDPMIIAKFFNPCGGGTWYATEFDSEHNLFFGYVSLFGDHNDEWGDFSLDELESASVGFGLGIERDRHYKEKLVSAEPSIKTN